MWISQLSHLFFWRDRTFSSISNKWHWSHTVILGLIASMQMKSFWIFSPPTMRANTLVQPINKTFFKTVHSEFKSNNKWTEKRNESQVLQRPCLAAHSRQKAGPRPWHCMGIVALFVRPVLQTARGFVQLSVLQRLNNRMLSENYASRLIKDIWLPTGKGQAPEQPVRAHKDRLFISKLCSTGHPLLLWLTQFNFSFLNLQEPHLLIQLWSPVHVIGSLQTDFFWF